MSDDDQKLLRPQGMTDEDYRELVWREAGKFNRRQQRQCAAIKADGTPCENIPIKDSSYCFYHGGIEQHQGVASAVFKEGRYSKHLPVKLREAYERGLNDDQLLSLRDELSLMKARVTELASQLQSGEGESLWHDLHHKFINLDDLLKKGEYDEARVQVESIRLTVDRGAANEDTWGKIKEALDGTQKLAVAEWKRLVDMRQLISTDKAVALVMAVVSSVRQHVKDPRVLGAIQRDVARIMMAPGAPDPTQGLTDYGRRHQQEADEANQAWAAAERAMRGEPDPVESVPFMDAGTVEKVDVDNEED